MATIPRNIQASATSGIQNAQNAAQNAQATAANVSNQQQQKVNDLQKAADDKVNYLKDQTKQSSKDIKAKLAAILTPVLLQFIRNENIADILIKKLEKETKKQLRNKGILIINNGVITFTPSNKGNYDIYKQNFDKKKASLEKTINTLKKTLDTLQNVLTYINLGLSGVKLYIKIKTKIVLAQEKAVQAELSSPTPGGAKPLSGQLLPKINKSLKQLPKDEEKIRTYQAVVTAINVILPIFNDMLSKLQIKINQLQFIINSGENSDNINSGIDLTISDVNNTSPEESEYVSSSGKSYILKLITLSNGYIQYHALDSYSKMKITQTAPSKKATPDELFKEIKQILG